MNTDQDYQMYLHLCYYKMSIKCVVHVHAQYEEHASKFKAKARLC